ADEEGEAPVEHGEGLGDTLGHVGSLLHGTEGRIWAVSPFQFGGRAKLSHPWVGWPLSFISARYRRAPSRRRTQSSSPNRAIPIIRRATTSPVASATPFEANGVPVSRTACHVWSNAAVTMRTCSGSNTPASA